MIFATSQHTRTQPCDLNPVPTGCESWKPILWPCDLNPVNQAIPSFFLLVWLIPHLSPTLSSPIGVTEALPEQDQVSVELSDQVATTVCPESETSRCSMNLDW